MSDRTLQIDVWSDVMCPFCYIGDAHLAQALESFPDRDSVEIRYRSFQLAPELEPGKSIPVADHLAQEKGMPRDQAVQMNESVAARARESGLEFRFDRALAANTHAAHQLTHLAEQSGLQHEMVVRLFRAFFVEGLDVGDHGVLADLAEDIGMDRDRATAALESREFADAVEADIARGRQIGVSGVPFFVLGNKYAVSGAQPVEVFTKALGQAWQDAAD